MKWYIKLSDGSMVGPYSSRDMAEQKQLSESIDGVIISGTDDGKEFLLG
jgi:hypothetical protein